MGEIRQTLNAKDGSIEYIKEYRIDDEYVKVAVRVSDNDKYFARSIYVLNKTSVKSFIAKGTLKKLRQLHYIQAEELFPQLFQLGHLPPSRAIFLLKF